LTFETRLLLSRAALIVVAIALAALAALRRDRLRQVIHDFFSAATSPTNLAIYRIVFFAAVLVDFGTDYDPATVDFYARLPAALHTPPEPSGIWGHVLQVLPVTPQLAYGGIILLRVFSFLAMIGLLSRFSAWMVVLSALYVLGIPQYFGKVNHTHHLLWFATILASSRCGDALSVDSLVRRIWRKRDGLPLEPPAPSRAYALPLRFVWILIGLIYFFPGLHKWWTGGIDWAFSDNFRNRMWEAWYQRDVFADNAWRPIFPLDHYPPLYKLMALGAIVFELSWVFLIFFKRLRPWAVVVALSFHLGTYFLMKIQFWSLLLNFVTFVDWDRLFRRFSGAASRPSLPESGNDRVPRVTVAVFVVLLVGNVLFGLKGARDGWPFTCYPTFARVIGPEIDQTDVLVIDSSGGIIPWDQFALKNEFSKSRYSALMKSLGEERDVKKMRAFWTVLAEKYPKFAEARRVEFYAVTYSTEPGPTHRVLSRTKVWETGLTPKS
jgi:hypothetical protein